MLISCPLLLRISIGYYQRGDPNDPLSIETSFLSLEVFQQQCNEAFKDHLPSWPQVQNINKYGGWDMQPSNVLFTNGECESMFLSSIFHRSSRISANRVGSLAVDPWRTLGLASIEPNSPQRKPTVIVPPYVA